VITHARAPIRFLLGAILALVALNAFGGGIYGMAGAKGVPREWLEGSPFTSYFIPSLFLFGVVGGTLAVAAVAVFANARWARRAALIAGSIMLAWIAVQLAVMGFVSWLQPVIAAAGTFVLALAWQLP
jgi:hypothetical protein